MAAGEDVDVELLAEVPAGVGLLARAAVTAVGGPGPAAGLPRRRVMVSGVRQDPARLAAYARVCGFTLRDAVPATWVHVLTFGLQMRLLTSRDFPFPALGMVHVANEMTLHRPVTLDEELTLSVHAENLRPHRSGASFDVVGRADVDGETVWDGSSEYLVRGARIEAAAAMPTAASPGAATPAVEQGPGPTSPSTFWRLPGGLGRRYAAVSGDLNPIHLHPLTARALGFPRAIAHGMWSHARVLAALQPRLPESYTASVRFRKPVLLPSTVGLGVRRDGTGWAFAVTSRDGATEHLLGTVG